MNFLNISIWIIIITIALSACKDDLTFENTIWKFEAAFDSTQNFYGFYPKSDQLIKFNANHHYELCYLKGDQILNCDEPKSVFGMLDAGGYSPLWKLSKNEDSILFYMYSGKIFLHTEDSLVIWRKEKTGNKVFAFRRIR